jgi:Divergent InlB B-repeat domain
MINRRHFLLFCVIAAATPCTDAAAQITVPFNITVPAPLYLVAVSASPSADGTVSGGGLISAGSSVTVTATANSGFSFVNWTANGSAVSTSASYTFTLNSNVTLVANFTPTTSSLPAANNVVTNWQMAGLQSIGGIPNRTTQCGSTVKPIGGGSSDAAQINAAIAACPSGDFVQLGAGTFTLIDANNDQITINKSITIRGTGTCNAAGTVAPYPVSNEVPFCATQIIYKDGTVLGENNCGTSLSGGTTRSCNYNTAIVLGAGANNRSWSGCDPWDNSTPVCTAAIQLDADAAQGATTIQVASTSGFSVGMVVLIDEASGAIWNNISNLSGITQVWAAPDALNSSSSPATGRVQWNKFTPECCDFTASQWPYQTQTEGNAWNFADRPSAELHQIKSIGAGPCPGTNCTLTFDDPLMTAYRATTAPYTFTGAISGTTMTTTGDSCQIATGMLVDAANHLTETRLTNGTYVTAVGSCSGGVGRYTVSESQTISSEAMIGAAHQALVYTSSGFVTEAGLENLTVERASGGNITLDQCTYCWVKNVESGYFMNGGINLLYAFRSQLEGNFIHNVTNSAPVGVEYELDSQFASTENLTENNIVFFGGKPFTARCGGAGSVVAYNYADDSYYSPTTSGIGDYLQEDGINASHAGGSHHTLFEGNWGPNMDSDDEHGASHYETYFRNWGTGFRTKFIDPENGATVNDETNTNSSGQATNWPLRASGPTGFSYYFAYVGNVLGTSGQTTATNGWIAFCTNGNTQDSECLWRAGAADNIVSNGAYDTNLNSSSSNYSYHDGNYDYLSNSIQWNSGDTLHVLPNSVYLTSAPAFFSAGASCTYPWPWVTPTGSSQIQTNSCGGSGLPAQARYNAGTPLVQP